MQILPTWCDFQIILGVTGNIVCILVRKIFSPIEFPSNPARPFSALVNATLHRFSCSTSNEMRVLHSSWYQLQLTTYPTSVKLSFQQRKQDGASPYTVTKLSQKLIWHGNNQWHMEYIELTRTHMRSHILNKKEIFHQMSQPILCTAIMCHYFVML